MPQRIPYPPCFSGCSKRECCTPRAYKYEWPELKGANGQHAKAVIEKENPYVTVVPGHSRFILADFCCNRVFVFLDENDNVIVGPRIG
nr:trypsin/subtilisin inhibitor-like [Coffea arabica]